MEASMSACRSDYKKMYKKGLTDLENAASSRRAQEGKSEAKNVWES